MSRLPFILLVLLLPACATTENGGHWYVGPPQHKGRVETAINSVIHEARKEGLALSFRWDRDRIQFLEVEADGQGRNGPWFVRDGLRLLGRMSGNILEAPRGVTDQTLRHEVAHWLFDNAGIRYGDGTRNGHHGHPVWVALTRRGVL